MRIRQMTAEDIQAVAQIEKECFSQPWSEQGFLDGMKDAIFFVAEDPQIAGYIGMYRMPPEGEITNVAVTRKMRKKGCGRELLLRMQQWAEKHGIDRIVLEVRSGNEPAIHLYRTCGFEKLECEKFLSVSQRGCRYYGVETIMLDVCLLGTAGMMPLPYRWLTSLMLRYNGSSLLIDCGEGTQIAIKEAGLSFKPIDILCVTHFHADHISGLPGLLLTMGNAERTEPLTIIGPKGLTRVVTALRTIAPELPFEINCIELTQPEESFSIQGYGIHAFRVKHNVICYGYSVEIHRAGRFSVERAREQNVPMKLWSRLQKGETIEQDGAIYEPQMVLGPARKGLKVTYCTDSRPLDTIVNAAKESDLFICEGMYAEKEKLNKAKQYKHMTFYEAADMAKRAEVKELWLTHFSPSLVRAEDYMPQVRDIFANAYLGKDGKSVELTFEEE